MKIDIDLSDNEIDRLFYELVLAYDDYCIDDDWYLRKVLRKIMKGIESSVKENCMSCMSRVSGDRCCVEGNLVYMKFKKIDDLNTSCTSYENEYLNKVVK